MKTRRHLIIAALALVTALALVQFSPLARYGGGFAWAVETPMVPTPGNVVVSTAAGAAVKHAIAAVALSGSDVVYFNTSNQLDKASAASSAASNVAGVITNTTVSAGQTADYIAITPGDADLVPGFTVTPGAAYCLGLTAGKWILCTDNVTNNYPVYLGMGKTTTTLSLGKLTSGAKQ
jgi:hypothetical protein